MSGGKDTLPEARKASRTHIVNSIWGESIKLLSDPRKRERKRSRYKGKERGTHFCNDASKHLQRKIFHNMTFLIQNISDNDADSKGLIISREHQN